MTEAHELALALQEITALQEENERLQDALLEIIRISGAAVGGVDYRPVLAEYAVQSVLNLRADFDATL